MAREKLDALGTEAVCERIDAGATQSAIAESVGVSVGLLNSWLHETSERSARAKSAMEFSAEAWLDTGLKALKEAPPEAAEVNRAKAIEQHCARRAAIRNPKYRDSQTLAGDPDNPLIPAVDLSTASPEQLRALATFKLTGE